MKIFYKFNLIIIFVTISAIAVYSAYDISRQKADLTSEMEDQAAYFANMVALGINSVSLMERPDVLIDYFDRMIPESNGWMRYAAITDLDNYAWIHTQKDKEYGTLEDEASLGIAKKLEVHNPLKQVYYSERFGEDILDVASLINAVSRDRGIVRFGFSFGIVQRKIDAAIRQSVIICAACIAIGIILSTLMSRLVSSPISKIVRISKAIAEGNLDLPVLTKSSVAEIKNLEKSIERMKLDLKYVYLGGMFADFHHSIKTDLGLISASIQYIRQNAGLPERQKGIRDKALGVMDRVDFINAEINKYRKYKKPQDVTISRIDINALVRDVIGSAHIGGNITVEEDLQPGLAHVPADPGHLKNALANIVSNAVESMPKGGLIRMRTEAAGNCVRIRISDTGCGIPKDDMARIFLPSYSTKRKKGGEGIGLAIARMIVEDVHGGKIDAESEIDKGTTFNVSLPCQM